MFNAFKNISRFASFVLIICFSCLESYQPTVKSQGTSSTLVVDGSVDVKGNASVILTRTIPLYGVATPPAELHAKVSIESSDGSVFALTELDSGRYKATGVPIHNELTYSLHIQTQDGSEYLSDPVHVYATPEIDKIYYEVSNDGENLDIKVDTNDPNHINTTGNYLWEATETYEYNAPYYSAFTFFNKQPKDRKPDELVYTCWRDELIPFTLGTTEKLSQGIISGHRIGGINRLSQKISVRYSILVRQRSISNEEYTYRTQLLKSTQQLGSIFDEIPGTVTGNIRSITRPGEYLLGYFRVEDVKEKRVFFERNQLPEYFRVAPSTKGCTPEATCRIDLPPPTDAPRNCLYVSELSSQAVITYVVINEKGGVAYYYFVSFECGDCRAQGGSTTKPDFW